MKKLLLLGLVVAAVSIPALASASSPASAWADVEEITFEPDAKDVSTATRVIIKGVFARSRSDAAFPTYAPPARGYFHYECPPGKLDLCRLEWKDIAGAIGTTMCAGFGDGSKSAGTLRAWCDAKSTSDVYPLHMGVQRTPWANGTCDGLKMFAPAPMCSATDAGAADTGTISDTGSQPAEDAAVTDTGTAPAATDTGSGGAPATPAKSDDKSGCSVGGGGSAAPGVMTALVLMGLGLAKRRRK